MSNILSGEKMVLCHSKTNYELPPVGVKDFEPNQSWLEQKQIQSALDDRKTLLEAERIEKEGNLMMADWRTEKHKAAVRRKGKHWETFGHHADNADWLFPEEVLFLMEMGCLECLYGEVPLSIQKGYSVLLKPENGCSLDEYRVFAHLCRAGYRVLRHLPNLTVTAYERTIRLDQHMKERKTYGSVVTEGDEMVTDVTQVSEKPEECGGGTQASTGAEEMVTEKTHTSNEPEEIVSDDAQHSGGPEKKAVEKTELSKKLEETVTDKVPKPNEPDGTVADKTPEPIEPKEMVVDKTPEPNEPKKMVTDKTPEPNEPMESVIDKTPEPNEPKEMVTDKTPEPNEPMEMVTDKTPEPNEPKEMVTDKTPEPNEPKEMVTDKTPEPNKPKETVTGTEEVQFIAGLTKRQLRKVHRRRARELGKLEALGGVKRSQELHNLRRQRRWLRHVMRKYRSQLTRCGSSQDRHQDIGRNKYKISGVEEEEDEVPGIPSERWQPPVKISDLPEDIEMTIGSTPAHADDRVKGIIEIIDIADTSSEEDVETDEVESDSDIEIIQEIRPQYHDKEEEEDEDDDLEIIEVPVPKKEIIVETLSSDSEEEEREDGSDSRSERSYDGNWKRSPAKKKNKFVRPPTMSHLTFAAVDEFCVEKKLPKSNVNGVDSTNMDGGDGELIGLECANARSKRPVIRVDKSRNEILDSMPTMAGQNSKLMTLESPDLRLVPDGISLKQQLYTFSTNALRARVFRQGFRGRRNFHGPRFTGFNPYYNNANGNFYPNQLSIGGPQGLFQAPQMAQLLGGGDISSVARGVMQIASALLMNMPQNNMNNGILPYNPRPHFPIMNQNFSQIESSNMPTPHFPLVNQNFSYNEPPNMSRRSFIAPQRNNSNLQNLFDMPQQRNFGTANHIRFPDSSSSPVTENQSFSVDHSRSSESDFDSSDHNFTPPIGNSHSAGRNFRNNRAANFRSTRGRFQKKRQNHRGGVSRRYSGEGTSHHPQWVDPAYIKPDVPLPGEQKPLPNFISIGSSGSSQKPVEIISIDDNDSSVLRGGVSNRFSKKKRAKRKLMRLKEKAKKMCLNVNSEGRNKPEIVFLDSPSVSTASADDSTSNSVKQENDSVRVKLEGLKQEETPVKREPAEEARVKVENEVEASVKTEEACGDSGVRVKVEHSESGRNVSVEIKIESLSDTSSVVSLPIANLVKEEPHRVKRESEGVELKTEAVDVVESVKTESVECKEGIVESTDSSSKAETTEITSEIPQEPMDTCASETERTMQNGNESVSIDRTGGNLEVEIGEGSEIDGSNLNSEILCSRNELTSEDVQTKRVSSWAEVKKNSFPLPVRQDTESEDEMENENDEEVRPVLRPKHCKTIGTVLSALQIFAPFSGSPPEDTLRLKISFDLYLPTEFRKSHRGLPQYRVVVFRGSEPLPSPAQLREVNSRFQDRVPVLTAVVAPGSVVFYIFSDIDLPQDSTSYTK